MQQYGACEVRVRLAKSQLPILDVKVTHRNVKEISEVRTPFWAAGPALE